MGMAVFTLMFGLFVWIILLWVLIQGSQSVTEPQLNYHQEVDLRSKGDEGGMLREIIIGIRETTIYTNETNAYSVAFPFEGNVQLVFSDGEIHEYFAFNPNHRDMMFADWGDVLEPLVEQYKNIDIGNYETIPSFIVGGTTFKLGCVTYNPETKMEYCNSFTGEST